MMKIVDSSIVLASQHELEINYTRQESLQEWRDPKTNPTGSKDIQDLIKKAVQDQLELSQQAKEALQNHQTQIIQNVNNDEIQWLSGADKQKILILERMLSVILGREIKIKLPVPSPNDSAQLPANLQPNLTGKLQPLSGQIRQGWGFIFNRSESYSETEHLSFSAKGTVKTADGKEIDFSVQLKMSRQFIATNNIEIKGGDALLDPLVINFNGNAAQLTDTKYYFDLDADGSEDQISFLREGSGFLALDQNNDGKINDGKELFGPTSGDGFAELAKYDHDQNGWIDENDPIFNKLRIWTKDAQGKDQLLAIGQVGIGAIYLGNINAQFGLKDLNNQTLGQAQRAGVFIKENGQVGVVQQVDLVV